MRASRFRGRFEVERRLAAILVADVVGYARILVTRLASSGHLTVVFPTLRFALILGRRYDLVVY
jgi:hypothetical protein